MTEQATGGGGGFTPGPWTVVEYEGNSRVIHYGLDNRICFMATPGAGDRMETIEANADLIAAAPALYEALRAAKAVLDTLTEPIAIRASSSVHVWAQAMEAGYKARKALDAATPQQGTTALPHEGERV